MSIVVKNLTHIYNEGMPFSSKALDNISFEIKDRDFVGLIGHTGSGKSTLIQHLNGILKPSSGDIYINDFKITDPDLNLTEIRKRVGVVFQYPEYQLFEETIEKDEIILKLKVSQDDVGKVIGKQGRIAKAIRTVLKSAGNKENVKVSLEIL